MLHLGLYSFTHRFLYLSKKGLLAKKATCTSLLDSQILLKALKVDTVALPQRFLRRSGYGAWAVCRFIFDGFCTFGLTRLNAWLFSDDLRTVKLCISLSNLRNRPQDRLAELLSRELLRESWAIELSALLGPCRWCSVGQMDWLAVEIVRHEVILMGRSCASCCDWIADVICQMFKISVDIQLEMWDL